ncbi:MAG: SDR family oxidoreductase [Chloroflexi bacterium]|nr:SDR family oxidoreductase [Chloroflexota bacterium]
MEADLNGKVVLVTGSARRVGRAIALAFARQGAHLVIHHHASDDAAAQTARDIEALGVRTLVVKADQSAPDDVARLFATVQSHFGRLDVLINSAANYLKDDFLDIEYAAWQKALGVNLTGPFLCSQHAARLMIASESAGTIINIADNGGLRPWKSRPHHSIAKAGVIMLTRVSALSLGPHNIRVNAVVPGPVLPPPGADENAWAHFEDRLPLRRTGHPDDVAQACIFLATNHFVTGAILNVDGGEILV